MANIHYTAYWRRRGAASNNPLCRIMLLVLFDACILVKDLARKQTLGLSHLVENAF